MLTIISYIPECSIKCLSLNILAVPVYLVGPESVADCALLLFLKT